MLIWDLGRRKKLKVRDSSGLNLLGLGYKKQTTFLGHIQHQEHTFSKGLARLTFPEVGGVVGV